MTDFNNFEFDLPPEESPQANAETSDGGDAQKPRRSQKRRAQNNRVWNVLSVLFLALIVSISAWSLIVFNNPDSFLNPFPPPTPIVFVSTTPAPTSTATMTPPPTETPVPTSTYTATPIPTSTLPPSPTPFTLFTPSATPEVTVPSRGYPFELQQGSPFAIANISHPELGCNWMGVAGQAFDLSNAPINGLQIRLGGRLPGTNSYQEKLSLTGAALNYGRIGYYEFTLANTPVASRSSVWVQLLSQEGVPYSEQIYFDTFDECDKNLIIINFKQIR
jgi:hypothetical protein